VCADIMVIDKCCGVVAWLQAAQITVEVAGAAVPKEQVFPLFESAGRMHLALKGMSRSQGSYSSRLQGYLHRHVASALGKLRWVLVLPKVLETWRWGLSTCHHDLVTPCPALLFSLKHTGISCMP
jgi:hypothetical protein